MKVMAMAIDTKEVIVMTTAMITIPEDSNPAIRIPIEIVIQATSRETTTINICYGWKFIKVYALILNQPFEVSPFQLKVH